MGFRVRKSFKLAPGVRMTVTPKGVGVSAGVRGARVSRSPTGRITRTLSLPGTGVSHVETLSSGRSRSRSARAAPASPVRSSSPSPGFTAPKWEKALHRALVQQQDPAALRDVAATYPEARAHVATFEALMSSIPTGDYERAVKLLAWVFHIGFDPAQDQFCQRYLPTANVTLGIADGVRVEVPVDRAAIGLALAEVYQEAGDLTAAVDVLEQLEPSTIAAVSLAELYAEQQRWDEIVGLTEGLTNEDEPSTYLLIQRGVALRESGFPDAAREALKEALRVRSRPPELRHMALVERADAFVAQGKKGMARKDLERVLAENSQFPGLRERLNSLPG